MRFSTASSLLTTIGSAALRPYLAAASVSSAAPDDSQTSEHVTDEASFGKTHLHTDPSSGIARKAQTKQGSTGVEDPENIDLAVSDADNLAEFGTKKVDAGMLAGDGAIKEEDTLERNLGHERMLYGQPSYYNSKASKSKGSKSKGSKSSKGYSCSKGSKSSKDSKSKGSKSGYGCGYYETPS